MTEDCYTSITDEDLKTEIKTEMDEVLEERLQEIYQELFSIDQQINALKVIQTQLTKEKETILQLQKVRKDYSA